MAYLTQIQTWGCDFPGCFAEARYELRGVEGHIAGRYCHDHAEAMRADLQSREPKSATRPRPH